MNHILIVIGFLFLLFVLSETKENFSQLILPNYNNTIFTGKSHLDNDTIIVKENSERKPSPVEDVKQPPYSRFTSGDDKISDSPEDIKEINSRLDEITKEMDIIADIKVDINGLDYKAICGEQSKKLSPADFRTPWRRQKQNHKSLKLLERYIIRNFADPDNKDSLSPGTIANTCFWGYEPDNPVKGCGLLTDDCIEKYKRDVYRGDIWMNSIGEDNKIATRQLIYNCTGYDPSDNTQSIDEIEEAEFSCRRLCCDNLLFPFKQNDELVADSDANRIYMSYLDNMYEAVTEGDVNDGAVPYNEDSLSGLYIPGRF